MRRQQQNYITSKKGMIQTMAKSKKQTEIEKAARIITQEMARLYRKICQEICILHERTRIFQMPEHRKEKSEDEEEKINKKANRILYKYLHQPKDKL